MLVLAPTPEMVPSMSTLGAAQLKLRYNSQSWLTRSVNTTSPKTWLGLAGTGKVPKSQTSVPLAPNPASTNGDVEEVAGENAVPVLPW